MQRRIGQRRTGLLALGLGLLLLGLLAGCDGADGGGGGADAAAADGTGGGSGDDTTADDAAAADGPIACGAGATCAADQACLAQWPGVCGGETPGPGGCPTGCQQTECGGGEYCLCPSFECLDVPAGCRACGCALDALPEWRRNACTCEEEDGHPVLECMGA